MNLINLLANTIIANAAGAPAGSGLAACAGAGAGAGGEQGGGSIWGMLLLYAVIFGVFYLVIIRPQSKRREQEEAMRKSVEVGDEIITIGGICGRVVSIKEDETLVIESGADRTKIKLKSFAVSSNESARERQPVAAEKKGFLSGLFGSKN